MENNKYNIVFITETEPPKTLIGGYDICRDKIISIAYSDKDEKNVMEFIKDYFITGKMIAYTRQDIKAIYKDGGLHPAFSSNDLFDK